MPSAKDLFNKLGNSGGGFKPAAKSVIPNAADAKAAVSGHKATEALKDGPKKSGGNSGSGGGGGTVPIGVRPKV